MRQAASRYLFACALLLPTAAWGLDHSVPTIHGDQSRLLLGDGTGVVVGIVDSGVDDTHPALTGTTSLGQPRMKAEANFVLEEPGNTGDDVFGHGTWVTSVVLSSDATFKGMAPDARFVNARVLDSTASFGSDPQVSNGIGYAISQNVDILNLSLNYFAPNSIGYSPLDLVLDWAVYNRGINVTTAAGNISQAEGGYQSVRSPASLFNGLACGRTTSPASNFDHVSVDSARATTQDGRSKPDIVAPGSVLTLANDDWEGAAADWDTGLNGTSFAAPHVAGLMAQEIEYGHVHGLSTNPMVIKTTIMNSATKVLNHNFGAWSQRVQSNVAGVLTVTAPLDSDSGAGQIDGLALYNQYSAGQHGPGSAPVVGWDLNTVTGTGSLDYDLNLPLLAGSNFTATLNWLRHIERFDDGNGIIDANDSYFLEEQLDNLDLELYLGSTLIAESKSTIDNIEHLYLPIATSGMYHLRVSRLFVDGSGNDELFAVAWSGTAVPEPAGLALVLAVVPMLMRRRRI